MDRKIYLFDKHGNEIRQFCKFIDSKRRIFVLLAVWYRYEGKELFRSSVDLLNYTDETMNSIPYEEFEQYLEHDMLKFYKQ